MTSIYVNYTGGTHFTYYNSEVHKLVCKWIYSPLLSTFVQQVQHQPAHSHTATANVDWIKFSVDAHSQPYYPHATSSSLHHSKHNQMSFFPDDPKMKCLTPHSFSPVMGLTSSSMDCL
jgi:hypothetical protein